MKIIKIITLGDYNVGKSSIINRLINNDFNNNYNATIGVDYHSLIYNNDNQQIKINFWDTAGQERYRTLIRSYFRMVSFVLMVFDLTNINSFNNIKKEWINYKSDFGNNAIIILIGNKCDIKHQNKVDNDKIQKFILNTNMHYIETSALNNINITELLNIIKNNILNNVNDTTYLIPKIKIKNKCCFI